MTSRQPSQPYTRQPSSSHQRNPSQPSRIPSASYQQPQPLARTAQDAESRRAAVAAHAAARSTHPPDAPAAPAVRRTLFTASAVRRPPSGASSRDDPFVATPATTTNAHDTRAQLQNERGILPDPEDDIIARDAHGQIIVEVPGLAMLGAGLAGGLGGTMASGAGMATVGGNLGAALLPEEVEEEHERERERRQIEMLWGGRERVDLGELKATLATSLQANVASLEKDNWMFESEDFVPMGT